jgi:D-alanine-D-alanine ligase
MMHITPQSLGRVVVLQGGLSAEREISLRSGAGVLGAFARAGVNAVGFDPAEQPLEALRHLNPDRVFIALHGRYGEDGTVQGALELMKIPYTGSGVLASSIALDKPMTKKIWKYHGLPTPDFLVLAPGFNAQEVVSRLGLPIAIKPACEGSSLGFTKVTAQENLAGAQALAQSFDDTVIAEQFVAGREFTCALIEDEHGLPIALPVIEIVAPKGQYDYQNKYFGSATQYLCPAPVAPEIESRMRAVSIEAYQAIGCSGWARVDLMWDGQKEPTLLEINTSPGMTDHSLVPMAAAKAGISFEQLVMQIAATASLKSAKSPVQKGQT